MKKKEEKKTNPEILNKKARFDFELLEFFEAGIVLTGSEVKSLREKKANLQDGFAKIRRGEIFLENFHITPYSHGGYANHPEVRPRKLLMHKKEILKLDSRIKEKGLVLVATKCYFNDRQKVKLQIDIAKTKKLYDKRDTIQKKEAKIDIEREMKRKKFD